MGDYHDTARALAAQYDDDSEEDTILPIHHDRRRTSSPLWSRRSLDASLQRPRSTTDKWLQQAKRLQNRGIRIWNQLSLLQRVALVAFLVAVNILGILALVYSERIFAWLAPAAKRWREMRAGWFILWVMTFFVSFPPMIGYSTCVTIGGFVFGMKGWFILASATIVGSTVSFLVSRTVLKSFVGKMTEKNKQFAALSLVLKHDGLKLLCMIRLCPLPYSFSNGAISTIPTVTWPNFMLATAIASPKLLLHIFVGARLGDIAENGDKMDFKTKAISYITMFIGIVLGVVTGYLIYARTKARAAQLEAEEVSAVQSTPRRTSSNTPDYVDDDDSREAREVLRARQSDVSLHTTYDDSEDLGRGYRDEFTDDEDARERDVFDVGDGETDDESTNRNEGKR